MKQCPKCGKPMNFQANKTNEKAPDWKCSDNTCKWQKKQGQWIASDFITAEWNDQPRQASPPQEETRETYGNQATTATPPITEEKPNWNEINFGKCKHQFLLEAFKHYKKMGHDMPDSNFVEKEAEEWAEMSMRILPKEKSTAAQLGIEQELQPAYDEAKEDTNQPTYEQ